MSATEMRFSGDYCSPFRTKSFRFVEKKLGSSNLFYIIQILSYLQDVYHDRLVVSRVLRKRRRPVYQLVRQDRDLPRVAPLVVTLLPDHFRSYVIHRPAKSRSPLVLVRYLAHAPQVANLYLVLPLKQSLPSITKYSQSSYPGAYNPVYAYNIWRSEFARRMCLPSAPKSVCSAACTGAETSPPRYSTPASCKRSSRRNSGHTSSQCLDATAVTGSVSPGTTVPPSGTLQPFASLSS